MLMRLALAASLMIAGSVAAAGEDVATVDAAAVSANWQSYVGQTITLTGGYIGVANIVGKKYPKAFYGRQGMKAIYVDAAGLDPAVAAALDPACKPYTEEQLADCAYDVTALLSANSAGDAPRLSGLALVKR